MVRIGLEWAHPTMYRDEGLSHGEVFGDAADNMKMLDAAEKQFEKEHAFDVPEAVAAAVTGPEPQFEDKSICGGDSTMSRSDYFMMGTSAIGSLEKDLDKTDSRPNFGLGSTVRSPVRVPCRVVRGDDTFQVQQEPAKQAAGGGKVAKPKAVVRPPPPATTKLATPKEFLPSFLEATTTDEATFLV